jgi:hypothetical protein
MSGCNNRLINMRIHSKSSPSVLLLLFLLLVFISSEKSFHWFFLSFVDYVILLCLATEYQSPPKQSVERDESAIRGHQKKRTFLERRQGRGKRKEE